MLLLSFIEVSEFYQQHLCGFCCLLRVTLEHEFAAYKAIAGDIPSETAVVSFWHASSDRFPLLSRLALWYLSVPTNNVDAERSISQYTTVSAPQRQRLSTSNLANRVIVAKNSKTGIA